MLTRVPVIRARLDLFAAPSPLRNPERGGSQDLECVERYDRREVLGPHAGELRGPHPAQHRGYEEIDQRSQQEGDDYRQHYTLRYYPLRPFAVAETDAMGNDDVAPQADAQADVEHHPIEGGDGLDRADVFGTEPGAPSQIRQHVHLADDRGDKEWDHGAEDGFLGVPQHDGRVPFGIRFGESEHDGQSRYAPSAPLDTSLRYFF